jgi:hypothetical protein
MMMRRFALVLLLGACTVGEDEATEGTPGASVSNPDNERLNGCHGQASSSVPANGKYTLTTFGGPGDHQSMSCGGYADGSTWYAASRQRYGCGAKLKIEANGKCVVTEALDYGPDVCVENAAGMPIIDASPKVSKALFGESGAGWSDHMVVTVTEVPKATPVGPCTASPPPAGMMCDSATLGKAVPPRTCVQAGSDSVWYQCNGQGWVTPVSTSTKTGPIGVCSTWNPL